MEQERPSDKDKDSQARVTRGLSGPQILEMSHTNTLSPTLTDEAAGAEAVHCGGI